MGVSQYNLAWLLLIAVLAALVLLVLVRRRHGRKRMARSREDISELSELFGMTSPAEREYVREYAANLYLGEGAIVDLGCWLGSFTVPLAVGLRANPGLRGRNLKIHAYDLFRWEDWMNFCVAGSRLEGRYKQGDSFLDAFVEQIAPVAELVEIKSGDLNQARWDPAVAIEYLVVDAMKSWDLTNSIVRNFFPALRPGLSLVHHQDFAHYYTPWIHLIMYRFKRHFEPLAYIREGSYVFRCREQLPPALYERSYSFDDFPDDEAEEAFEYSLSLIPHPARLNVLAARIMMRIHREDWVGASADLERARAAAIPMEKELKIVAATLDKRDSRKPPDLR